MSKSAETKARELLFEIGVDDPSKFTSDELLPLSTMLTDNKEGGMTKEAMREAVQGMSQLAHLVSNYYLELKSSGFTDDQSLALSAQYQTAIITMSMGNK